MEIVDHPDRCRAGDCALAVAGRKGDSRAAVPHPHRRIERLSDVLAVDGIEIHVDGDGAETIVMVHGWPDTYRIWDAQVAFLKSRYRCARFTLPGFDIARPRRAYSLEEVCDFIRRVVERVSPGRKVTILLHDWGCLFGYQFY